MFDDALGRLQFLGASAAAEAVTQSGRKDGAKPK
jgi:hypothetical protein